jgi:glucose/mannose transport system substrate-binding protein
LALRLLIGAGGWRLGVSMNARKTLFAGSLMFLACSATPTFARVGNESAQEKLTFYHWWNSPAESKALGALVHLFREKYPDVLVFQNPVHAGRQIRETFSMMRRLDIQKEPPDAFQMNAGCAAQIFFEAGLLSPLDDLWAREKLERVIPSTIQEMNKFDGHYYSIPVNVHRTNVVWYNKQLLDKVKIRADSLTTWEAFFKAAQALKAEGVSNPIQMGETWTAAHVFECIMASLGITAYEDWINGKITAADDPRLTKAFLIFKDYLSLVNKDHGDVTWDTAVRRVMSGEGAFCLMGDWANGEFALAGMKYERDYGTFLVPGTKGMFGLDVDTFEQPRGLKQPINSERWLTLVSSREGQDTFNPLKGSISARVDADVTRYDAYQRSAIADLKSAEHMYPNSAAAIPEGFNQHLNEILFAFMGDQDVDKAATAAAAAATQLKLVRHSRTWLLK